jgi:hypothetical protein
MPNWCWNTITIEGDYGTLSNMDFIMKSDEGERNSDDAPEMGQPMRLVPMPEVLRGTRSPAPTGQYDPDGRFIQSVIDPTNDHWTAEKYAADKAEWVALIKRAERAKDETGYDNWHSWASAHWGTKWSMDVTGYTYDVDRDPEAIHISGNTAWAPPIGLLEKVSQKFGVKVSITYVEEGMDFVGASVIIDGVTYDSCGSIMDHVSEDFDWDDDDAWDIHAELSDRLIDHHERIAALEADLATV